MFAILPTNELVIIVLVIAVASYVQAISGFGFALFAVPLMGLAVDIRLAVVVSTVSSISTNAFHAWHDRERVDKRIARRMIFASFGGMPIGVAMLVWFSKEQLQLLVGITVVVMTVLLARRVHVSTTRPSYEIIAGVISGALATSVSTNGPPLVVVLQAKKMKSDEFRATLNMIFVTVGLVSLGMFAIAGRITEDAMRATIWSFPGLALGLWSGRIARTKISEDHFRKLVFLLLSATGVASIIGALV